VSKKYTAAQVKAILHCVLTGAYSNIDSLSKELSKLKKVGEEKFSEPDSGEDATLKARLYSNTILLLNDIISPAHDISLQLFEEQTHAFIKQCKDQQKKWLKIQDVIEKKKKEGIDPIDFSTTEKQ